MQAEETVLSEVHMETCPPAPPGTTWSTRFLFSLPSNIKHPLQAPLTDPTSPDRASDSCDSNNRDTLDDDGDLILRSRPKRKQHSITIHHSLATTISRCGEQVWQGACLLGDWVLANRQQLLQGQVVVEFGAGVGLVSVPAGMFAKTVFLTDADAGALQLAQRNTAEAAATVASVAHPTQTAARQASCVPAADVRVRILDWFQLFDTHLQQLPQTEVLQLLNSTSKPADGGPSPAGAAGGKAQQQQLQQQQQQEQPQQQDLHEVSQQQQQQGPEREQDQQSAEAAWQWSPSDLQLLAQTTLWLAADVVYDQTLTDAFMHTAAALMRWQQQQQERQHMTQSLHCQCSQQQPSAYATDASTPVAPPTAAAAAAAACGTGTTPQPHPPAQPRLVVALEKRYNFTLRDMDAVAPAFDHFMSYIQPSEASLAAMPPQEQQRLRHHHQQQQQQQCACLFKGQRIDVDSVPQALQYDRSSDYLELWELTVLT